MISTLKLITLTGGVKSLSAYQRVAKSSLVVAVRPYARAAGFGVRQTPRVVTLTGGKTIRERLLGPTTGKPFLYGTYGLIAASGAGLGMLCFYGLGMSNEVSALDKSATWAPYVKERIRSTYGYLTGSLCLTAGTAYYVSQQAKILRLFEAGGILKMVALLAAVIGTGAICRGVEYKQGTIGLKQAAWLLHCGVMGGVLAPLCYLGGPLLIRAAWYTAGVVGGLSLLAVSAPSEQFLKFGAPLAMGLGVVFVSSIGTFFFAPTSAIGASIWAISIYGGLVLFGAFLLYDTQRAIALAERHPQYALRDYDPINAQLRIYMDTLNIFIRIAYILAGQRRK